MDHVIREQAINFFFKPTKVLMQRYGRYAAPDEVTTFERRFDDLQAELALAFDNGEAYEARAIRMELKELCQDLSRRIDLHRRTAMVM